MSDSNQRMTMIRAKLEEAFEVESLQIIDESHKHAGHASAKGGGHFIVQIVSKDFEGKGPVQRHRMIFDAMGDLMHTEVHALSIQADTPK